MWMKSTGRWGALLAMVMALAGCSREPAAPKAAPDGGDARYTIVATVGMVADIARNVAGDRANVRGIIGTGVDPHLYKPTRNDVAALMAADVILYSGLLLEGRMVDTLAKMAAGKPVQALTEGLDESFLLTLPGMAGHHDPHVWMDVGAWIEAVKVAAAFLSEYDPAGHEQYAANAARFVAALTSLDAYARTCIGSIPEHSRVLVTAHDAFNYFGRAYGIEVRGIQGISTESEAGLDDIRRLVDLIVERDVQAVFVESSVPAKNVRALIEGAEARGHAVRIGGELFSDAMGIEGTYEGSYIGMLDHNVTIITHALGGEAPARGLNGRLALPEGAAR
jgi:manganese/zinc/iron transport system substrate-binding protein